MKLLLLLATAALPLLPAEPTKQVTVNWTLVTNAHHYAAFQGTQSRTYTNSILTTNLSCIFNVPQSGTNYFAVIAYDTNGIASDLSMEAMSYSINLNQKTNTIVTVSLGTSTNSSGPFITLSNIWQGTNPAGNHYFKLNVVKTNF